MTEELRKTYHDEGLTAYVTFEESYYTPAEVEGLVQRLGEAAGAHVGGGRHAVSQPE